MDIALYILRYFLWHYTRAIRDLFKNWLNFIWFTINYFSIPLLLQTFFAPWKRLGEERRGFFDFTFIVIDISMRLFGIFLRTITIAFGLICTLAVVMLGPAAFLIWIAWPMIIVYLLTSGYALLMK